MIHYRPLEPEDVDEVYALIKHVFYSDVAPGYTNQGTKRFFTLLTHSWLHDIHSDIDSFILLAEENTKIIGVIAVINTNHIALLFVDSSKQSRGIGTQLIHEAIGTIQDSHPEINNVTVRASPNSVSFYQRSNFTKQAEEIDEQGMRFTPMIKHL